MIFQNLTLKSKHFVNSIFMVLHYITLLFIRWKLNYKLASSVSLIAQLLLSIKLSLASCSCRLSFWSFSSNASLTELDKMRNTHINYIPYITYSSI